MKTFIFIFSFFLFALQPAFADTAVTFPVTAESQKVLMRVVPLMSFLQQTYSDQIKRHDSEFQWKFDWNQSYIGAGSMYDQNIFLIMVYGGLFRAPISNFQMWALTLCHEYGHFLGGAPKQKFGNQAIEDWSSAEGQADWFAATDCLPKVYDFYSASKQESFISDLQLINNDQQILQICQNQESSEKCRWVISAAKTFVEFSEAYFATSASKPNLSSKASEVPEQTLVGTYPSLQCRLDTYRIGALYATSNLSVKNNFYRPRCWFKPE